MDVGSTGVQEMSPPSAECRWEHRTSLKHELCLKGKRKKTINVLSMNPSQNIHQANIYSHASAELSELFAVSGLAQGRQTPSNVN